MDRILQQVSRVRRRLVLQKFGKIFSWMLFASLCVALLALAVPKIWPLGVDAEVWRWGWLGGSVAIALLASGIMTGITAPKLSDAAVEIDQRFKLKERLSSSLSLSPDELDSEVGRALLEDASRRAERLNVSEQFRFQARRVGLLPVIPAVFMFVLVFVPDALRENEAQAKIETLAEQQVKKATSDLKKKIEMRRKRAEAKGLEDAGELFSKIEAELDKLTDKKKIDQKKAMIALNDIKKQLEERRNQLGSKEELRKQLSNLKNMERGPADKLARSMQNGDLAKAEQEIRKLIKKLSDGTMTKEQQKQLEKQMEAMEQAIKDAVKKHEQEKAELEKKIEQAKQQGRDADAKKMQQQLKQMQQMDQQMQQMQQLAEGLQQAKESMQKGDPSSAAEKLDELAEQLEQMNQEMQQLEDMLDQLSQTKQQMRCEGCKGSGCKQCQGNGMGMGNGEGDKPGSGLGQGAGQGDRPEEETETGNYDSQVRDRPKNGRGIASGFANGPNRKGITRAEIRDAVQNALQEESNPLEDRPLPRAEREHTEQYFNRLRSGTE